MKVMEPWGFGGGGNEHETPGPPPNTNRPRSAGAGSGSPCTASGAAAIQARGHCPGTEDQPSANAGAPAPGRANAASTRDERLTGRQMLGSKSGQLMLETDEMSWLWIFTQLKKVQLFVGSLFMSPGYGTEDTSVKASRRPTQRHSLGTPGSSTAQPRAASRTGGPAHKLRSTGQVTPRRGPWTAISLQCIDKSTA